ncbi:sigma-54 dependent transcriptional regulator [bacterium 210820-DFI.6.37]|nr:sigma-54 dependent transcriptional regulator [bacterium 210820-DFI.6.37]
MYQTLGMERVIEPKQVLPTSAWKVDNNRRIAPHEMRISIKRVHVEGTSFRQICMEANNNEDIIKEKIIDIVIKRGKLHNPVTDTGGLLYGQVEEIGSQYRNPKGLKVGEEVLCNASLATIPIYISRITKVDMAYTQVEAEGYAILGSQVPVVRRPEGLPLDLLLFTFNESGTIYRVSTAAEGKKRFLVVGNNLMMNLLFGYTIRKVAGETAEIICFFDKKTDMVVKGRSIDQLMELVFTEIHYVNILQPMDCLSQFDGENLVDLSVNCADIPGAETINILATRSGGTVIFANLISNYNIALYITESISRQLDIRCADGYLEAYDEFDIQLVRELAPYLEQAVATKERIRPQQEVKTREERLFDASGYKNSLAEDFISESRAMTSVLSEIIRVSKYDCNVLITGDTGVGKEKVANLIQKNSSRKMQPFVKINCASISPGLIESELFGYEKGAFTGASAGGKKGYFEQADNGVIFLDEVGELPLDIQAKLLRVIQDGEFFRVGGTVPVKTNVRILSATNRDLEDFIEQKLFRRDLYYRLNVFPIKVPALNERKADIPPLVHHFVRKYSEKFGVQRSIDADAVDYLQQRDWPGNIRELENVVQRLLISCQNESVTVLDVMKELHGDVMETTAFDVGEEQGGEKPLDLEKMVDNFEKNIIRYACEKYGSTRKAAKAIGISQTQLVRKKKKYQL